MVPAFFHALDPSPDRDLSCSKLQTGSRGLGSVPAELCLAGILPSPFSETPPTLDVSWGGFPSTDHCPAPRLYTLLSSLRAERSPVLSPRSVLPCFSASCIALLPSGSGPLTTPGPSVRPQSASLTSASLPPQCNGQRTETAELCFVTMVHAPGSTISCLCGGWGPPNGHGA